LRFGATSLKHATLFIYFPSILMSLGQGMLIPALPVLGQEFGVSGAIAVQALTAQLLGRTLALIPAGGAIDRWGAKPVMIVGAALAISLAQENTHAHRQKKSGSFLSLNAIKHIHPYYRLTYAVLFISTFGQMARGQITNSALPLYTQQELMMTPTQTGIIFSFIAIVTFSMIIPTGFISDKLGRKWAAVPAAVLSLIGFIMIPFFDTLPLLILAGLVIGVANGLAMGAMTIYTFDIVPAEFRGQLQALRRSVGEVGAVLSPPVVGIMAEAYDASMAFWVVAPLHAVAAILLIFVAKESLKKRLPPGAPGSEAETTPAARP
jgi:MFS family permease